MTIVGPDGRAYLLEYRVQRYASGTGVELVEPGGGYHFSTISTVGRHDQPLDAQVRHLRQAAEAAIANEQLRAHPPDGRMLLAGDEVVGRLVWPGSAATHDHPAYNVVVDGREMTWEQFGRTLEPFEGFRFRLVIEDIDEVGDDDR